MSLTDLIIPGWVKWAAIGGALLLAGYEYTGKLKAQSQLATAKQEWADQRATLTQELADANQRERAKEFQRTTDLQKAANEADKLKAAAIAANDSAMSAGRKLRDLQASAIASLRTGANSAAPDAGKAADATADLLELVRTRLDDATDTISRFADQSRIAGLACEVSYGSLAK